MGEKEPELPKRSRRLGRIVFTLLIFVVVTLADYAREFASTHPLLSLVGAATATAITLVLVEHGGIGRVTDRALKLSRPLARHPRRTRLVAAGLIALVVPVAVYTSPLLADAVGGLVHPSPFANSCEHPTELNILTSSDDLQPMRSLAEAYARSTADRHDHCPTVFPFVFAADSAAAATTALARAWRADDLDDPRVSLGPRPDVWLPDSTVDVSRVVDLAKAEQEPNPVAHLVSIASSPMVLGLIGPVSEPAGGALADQVDSYLAQGRPLLAPDPDLSTTGLFAAEAYLRSRPDTTARRRTQESTAVGDDSTTLLCRYRQEVSLIDHQPTAVLTSSQVWQQFATGGSLGPACPGGAGPWPDAYAAPTPRSVPVLDHPMIDFSWTDTRRLAVVNDFRDWLGTPAGMVQLSNLNLDPPRPDCSVLAGNPCVPGDLGPVLDLYHSVRLPGRVLLALDTSQSMATVATGGLTRFQIAAQGVRSALAQVGPKDQVGLLLFPDASGRASTLVGRVDQGSPGQRDRILSAVRRTRPNGASTPLYQTILDGLRAAAGPATDVQARALVVLTDGHDTSSLGIDSVVTKVRELAAGTGAHLYIIATGDATCGGTGGVRLDRITAAGHGRCFQTSAEGVPAVMTDLFSSLWSGR